MATDGVHQEKKKLRSTQTSLNMSEPSTKYTHFIEEYIEFVLFQNHWIIFFIPVLSPDIVFKSFL